MFLRNVGIYLQIYKASNPPKYIIIIIITNILTVVKCSNLKYLSLPFNVTYHRTVSVDDVWGFSLPAPSKCVERREGQLQKNYFALKMQTFMETLTFFACNVASRPSQPFYPKPRVQEKDYKYERMFLFKRHSRKIVVFWVRKLSRVMDKILYNSFTRNWVQCNNWYKYNHFGEAARENCWFYCLKNYV
jgi:hypothetical protein